MNNKLLLLSIVVALSFLSGCRGEEYPGDMILCDPTAKEAYLSVKGIGDTSFVSRLPQSDSLCNKECK